MTSLLVLSILCAAPTRDELARTVRDRFEAVGRSAPPLDAALSRAADELAKRALVHGVEDASSLLRVTSALSAQSAFDPNPVVVALRASTSALSGELKKQDLGKEPTTHVGVGLAVGPERSALIVLLAQRRIELSPFHRTHPKPVGAQKLCGRLMDELDSAEVFITRPQGVVERLPMPVDPPTSSRCAMVSFGTAGRHAVEVLANGPRGPEVAALFFVDVGAVRNDAEDFWAEPHDFRVAQAQLLARINALRVQMGRLPVQLDEQLGTVAQAWAQRLADEVFFSHVAPDGNTLKQRLTAAGYEFSAAGENLGLSSGPLAAHFGIEHSPGHRSNLLEASYQKLGLGLATRADGLVVLVEVLAHPIQVESSDKPLEALYASLASERARLKLPALTPNSTLERLAQAHAKEALAKDLPKAEIPGRPRLHDRAFELIDELSAVSVDVFVADAPRLTRESKNLATPTNRWVGVGLVKGDSKTFGRGRYWVVVIYGVPSE